MICLIFLLIELFGKLEQLHRKDKMVKINVTLKLAVDIGTNVRYAIYISINESEVGNDEFLSSLVQMFSLETTVWDNPKETTDTKRFL